MHLLLAYDRSAGTAVETFCTNAEQAWRDAPVVQEPPPAATASGSAPPGEASSASADGTPAVLVSRLDLSAGPELSRPRCAIGFGWQAREYTRRVAQATGRHVDACIEVVGTAPRHLLGLGRADLVALRCSTAPFDTRAPWLERQSLQEGAHTLLQHDEPAHEAARLGATLGRRVWRIDADHGIHALSGTPIHDAEPRLARLLRVAAAGYGTPVQVPRSA